MHTLNMVTALALLAFMQIGSIFPIHMDYVAKRRSSTPFTRRSCADGHVALRCTEDIHCPKGSRCYVSLEFPESAGVCVVTYDSKFVLQKIDKIWDT